MEEHPLFPKSPSERAMLVAITEEGARLSAEGKRFREEGAPLNLDFPALIIAVNSIKSHTFQPWQRPAWTEDTPTFRYLWAILI